MIAAMNTYRIFCRDRAPKFSGFRDVKASTAREALAHVCDVPRVGDMTGRSTAGEYWHAVQWDVSKSDGKRRGGPADARGQAWLEANV